MSSYRVERIWFVVNERGQSQGAITAGRHSNAKLKPFREAVGWEALRARTASGMHAPAGKDVPIMLDLDFFFARPASVPPEAIFPLHGHIPDLSHVIRSCEDAMTGVMYEDDRQVVECHARKLYGTPRCEIGVRFAAVTAPE